jgi:hypothetical protein
MSELDETPVVAPVDALRAEAATIAAANPPSRVVATLFLGLLTGIGVLIGGTWLLVSKAVIFCALAVKYGYRKGAKVQTEPKKRGNPARTVG